MKWINRTVLLILLLAIVVFACFFRSDIPVSKLQEKYATAPSKFVKIQGMQVHYREEGNGTPLLLLHGTSSSLFTWDAWTASLKDSFRVIRLDLPGFGLTGSNPMGDYGIRMYTSLLQVFLEKLNIDTCYIAGNSLGGYIAWNMAVKYPQKIRKVILLDAVAYHEALPDLQTKVKEQPSSLAFRLAGNPATSWLVRWTTPKSLVKKSILEVYGDDSKVTDSLVDFYYNMILREGNRQAFVDNVVGRRQEGGEELLPGLQTPVLIQWGKEDKWVDVSMGEWFSEVLPNDTMIVYDGAGHIPMEEIPEITARDAAAFLKK